VTIVTQSFLYRPGHGKAHRRTRSLSQSYPRSRSAGRSYIRGASAHTATTTHSGRLERSISSSTNVNSTFAGRGAGAHPQTHNRVNYFTRSWSESAVGGHEEARALLDDDALVESEHVEEAHGVAPFADARNLRKREGPEVESSTHTHNDKHS